MAALIHPMLALLALLAALLVQPARAEAPPLVLDGNNSPALLEHSLEVLRDRTGPAQHRANRTTTRRRLHAGGPRQVLHD